MIALSLALMLNSALSLSKTTAVLPTTGRHPLEQTALRHGARMFFHYCVACHSLKYMHYSRIARDLKLSRQQVMTHLNLTGGRFNDPVISSMPAALATKAFGKVPPDLSLEIRAKGAVWAYNYLNTFYLDPKSPIGWNNTVLPNTTMPFPLWELQGEQVAVVGKDGHQVQKLEIKQLGTMKPAQYRQATRDLIDFLTYVSDPAALQRRRYGIWVMLFLVLFTFLAWLLKKEYWKDIH